ncbi:MAG: pyrimidine-nucleoside phosphorylase [Lachnospiraceae bacterium]|nr:pyrimidine-nucleoside phosphorylase [Lachnospiraceae bacterium]
MRMYDLIKKKRDGLVLEDNEIRYVIEGFTKGEIPDYQMSAFLMAVYYKGMNDHEILILTQCMAESGDMVDLSDIPGIKVDKHSTGGVGDKTTLVVAPIVASCGVKVAKMSGRGLGHTGGTIDKLESIPGYRTDLDREEFFEVVKKTGLSVIGQSGNLTPADKKMYALRDVTATVDSIPLIASSIMSKKIAAGSDAILLDVKTGSGAFMQEVDDAIKLAEVMVALGENAGRSTRALITDMDTPLGKAIGNSLEVIEAVNTLKGEGPEDLTIECINLAANMMVMADLGDPDECRRKAEEVIGNGAALEALIAMVEAQGGDASVIRDTDRFGKARYIREVTAVSDGYVVSMDAAGCGIASGILGAGRETLDSVIDYAAGIILEKKTGDEVKTGDVLAILYTNDEDKLLPAEKKFRESVIIENRQVERKPLIYALCSKDGVKRFDGNF